MNEPASTEHLNTPVALITGGARRIGATIATLLHKHQYRVLIHCRHSKAEAQSLADTLNQQRPQSAAVLQANLGSDDAIEPLAQQTLKAFGRLDVLINNASTFYPTPVGTATPGHWDDLMSSNAKAPYFLSQALAPELIRRSGSIVNIVDIHGERPLKDYTLYCMAKAANAMLVQSLALELAPDVRVNGVAPGAILWPEDDANKAHPEDRHHCAEMPQTAELDTSGKQALLERVPLGKLGNPDNIAQTVLFLLQNTYITGQIIPIDGGRLIQ